MMRSSGSKPSRGKSVSICADPPIENGPCRKEEVDEEPEEVTAERIHAVAAKVVEDVIRMASEAANERVEVPSTSHHSSNLPEESEDPEASASSSSSTTVYQEKKEEKKNLTLQRLPTIQIDTVPSMPPSPTEWSPPPPEDIIHEVNEALEESQIEIEFESLNKDSEDIPEELQEFAAAYVQDLLSKAMEIAEERRKSEEAASIRDVAAQVVEEVIAKATETASERIEKLPSSSSYPGGLPMIHIDTVPSMPPSPTMSEEEEERKEDERKEEEAKKEEKKDIKSEERELSNHIPEKKEGKIKKSLRITYQKSEEEEEKKQVIESEPTPEKYAQDTEELREFAASYVKDIISRAITIAEEKLVPTVPFNFEDVDLMKTSGPWYIRAREALMRVLRSACFCAPRRSDS